MRSWLEVSLWKTGKGRKKEKGAKKEGKQRDGIQTAELDRRDQALAARRSSKNGKSPGARCAPPLSSQFMCNNMRRAKGSVCKTAQHSGLVRKPIVFGGCPASL